MSEEFAKKSDDELLSLIKRVEQELERRKRVSKDKLKEEIEQKLRNAGLDLGDLFPGAGGKARSARVHGVEAYELRCPSYYAEG